MMNIKFLNVDLDIESQQDISLMMKELKENVPGVNYPLMGGEKKVREQLTRTA